jgi:hypothetical protein
VGVVGAGRFGLGATASIILTTNAKTVIGVPWAGRPLSVMNRSTLSDGCGMRTVSVKRFRILRSAAELWEQLGIGRVPSVARRRGLRWRPAGHRVRHLTEREILRETPR